jgi:hypothetical protein
MIKVSKKLVELNIKERETLVLQLLQEQVVEQRSKLNYWRSITEQPAQIDTGYVAQHLVSIITGIKGGGFRGKGEDLEDNSEIKSANFLDSLDRRGAISPRWNFMANDIKSMETLLQRPAIYLVSLDFNPNNRTRARVWRLHPDKHQEFRNRYIEWMEKLGKPKLADPRRPYANFQLFPPRFKTMDDFARHGNGRDFARLKIYLETPPAAVKIFHAEQDTTGQMVPLIASL